MKKKGKNRRSQHPYPNLEPKLNLKVRQELVDYDYIDKLSPEEKEWLNKFTGEYIGASFKKTEGGNYSSTNLHTGKKGRKDCYDRNNWRNNDVYSISKSSDMLKDETKLIDHLETISNVRSGGMVEDQIITLLDKDALDEV